MSPYHAHRTSLVPRYLLLSLIGGAIILFPFLLHNIPLLKGENPSDGSLGLSSHNFRGRNGGLSRRFSGKCGRFRNNERLRGGKNCFLFEPVGGNVSGLPDAILQALANANAIGRGGGRDPEGGWGKGHRFEEGKGNQSIAEAFQQALAALNGRFRMIFLLRSVVGYVRIQWVCTWHTPNERLRLRR
eukprot:159540-Amorphochlora_amoeboformis.AAC.1